MFCRCARARVCKHTHLDIHTCIENIDLCVVVCVWCVRVVLVGSKVQQTLVRDEAAAYAEIVLGFVIAIRPSRSIKQGS